MMLAWFATAFQLVRLAAAFNAPSWTWTSDVAPGPMVSGHVQCADAQGRVLAFGGLTGSVGSPATNELWAFQNGAWTLLRDGAGGPGPRMYSAGAGGFRTQPSGGDPACHALL